MSNIKTMDSVRVATATAVVFFMGGCASNEAAVSDPSGASNEAAVSDPSGASNEANPGGLPVVQQNFDEDGPTDVAGAWQASDYVVLATIAGSTDGARFYGVDGAEDIGGSQWTEDVELHLKVSQFLKGAGEERLDIRWPTYLTTEQSSGTRTAVLEIEGVQRDLSRSVTYLFFLKDQGEPWGLTSVSLGASLMQVGPDMRVDGQVSTVFSDLRGQRLADVLPESAPELDAG